jgi:hypothetical protein
MSDIEILFTVLFAVWYIGFLLRNKQIREENKRKDWWNWK